MVDMKMGAEHIVDFVVSDAERKQLVPPALLARKIQRRQMLLEDRLVIGRKEVLRPPPWAFAFNHRVDGDVANPELFHFLLLPELPVHRNGQLPAVQAEDDFGSIAAISAICAAAQSAVRAPSDRAGQASLL